jgi:hypothetical protein
MTVENNLVLALEQLAVDMVAVEDDVIALTANLGDITQLTTTQKESAVAAINSIQTRVNALELDAVTLTQVNQLIATAKTQILGSVPEAYNTLEKIATEISAVKDRVTAAETAITAAQTAITNLQNSVTALGTNKADKSALALTDAALTTLQNTLSALINDSLVTATDKTYSIDKILSVVSAMGAQVKQDLLGGVGAAYDTLLKLKNFIDGVDLDNDTAWAALNAIVATHVSFADVQALTDEQKARARTNIGAAAKAEFDALVTAIGDLARDFKAAYLAKKVALRA